MRAMQCNHRLCRITTGEGHPGGVLEGCWRGAQNTSEAGCGHATTTELVVFCPPPACVGTYGVRVGSGCLLASAPPSLHPMHLASGRGLCQPKRDIREPIATATPRPTARTWPLGSTGARGLACQLLVAARIWRWRVRWRPVGHEDRRLRANPGRAGWELNSSRPRLRRSCRACPSAAERNQTQTKLTDTTPPPSLETEIPKPVSTASSRPQHPECIRLTD